MCACSVCVYVYVSVKRLEDCVRECESKWVGISRECMCVCVCAGLIVEDSKGELRSDMW